MAEQTFETFQVGPFNRFTHLCALHFADNSEYAYNPLFVYGVPGCGKTHLLRAVWEQAQATRASRMVALTEGQALRQDARTAIERGRTDEQGLSQAATDVLLIDDADPLLEDVFIQPFVFDLVSELALTGCQLMLTFRPLSSDGWRFICQLGEAMEWSVRTPLHPRD